jgi:Arc/MetJ-type ribon-helix-helix transcriptional regulator
VSKSYTPGAEAGAIIARQIPKGYFTTPDEAVRTAVQMLEEHEAGLADLRVKIDEADAAYERGITPPPPVQRASWRTFNALGNELSRQEN